MSRPSRGRRRTPRDERRRALGQNFLRDEHAVRAVLAALDPRPGELVVDLGAGDGALTHAAARAGHRVLAVEVDGDWASRLRRGVPAGGRVEVVHADALTVALPSSPFRVVSDAPFGIGTRLVRRLVTDAHGMTAAVVVLQHETAVRLAGRPRAGRFAATWAPWFELRVRGRIARTAYRPVPSVDAGILAIRPRSQPLLSPAAFGAYDAFLAAVFAGRAPTLADRVAAAAGARRRVARAALAAAHIAPGAPPSAVAPERYAALFLAVARPRATMGRSPIGPTA